MDEFSTYVFKENEEKTNNKKVVQERVYYSGIILFLIGVVFLILESGIAIYFIVIGFFVVFFGKAVMSGARPSVGHSPMALTLKPNSILLGHDTIEIKNNKDVELRIIGYKGQGISRRTALYETHNGNENIIRIKHNNKVAEFRFVLESEHHKDQLIKFCDNTGYTLQRSLSVIEFFSAETKE